MWVYRTSFRLLGSLCCWRGISWTIRRSSMRIRWLGILYCLEGLGWRLSNICCRSFWGLLRACSIRLWEVCWSVNCLWRYLLLVRLELFMLFKKCVGSWMIIRSSFNIMLIFWNSVLCLRMIRMAILLGREIICYRLLMILWEILLNR